MDARPSWHLFIPTARAVAHTLHYLTLSPACAAGKHSILGVTAFIGAAGDLISAVCCVLYQQPAGVSDLLPDPVPSPSAVFYVPVSTGARRRRRAARATGPVTALLWRRCGYRQRRGRDLAAPDTPPADAALTWLGPTHPPIVSPSLPISEPLPLQQTSRLLGFSFRHRAHFCFSSYRNLYNAKQQTFYTGFDIRTS